MQDVVPETVREVPEVQEVVQESVQEKECK